MPLLETSPSEKEALNRDICLLIIEKKGIFYGEGKDMHTHIGNKLRLRQRAQSNPGFFFVFYRAGFAPCRLP